MKKTIITVAIMLISASVYAGESLKVPTDMTQEAQQKMNTLIAGYNRCIMQGRSQISNSGGDPRIAANKVLQSCEAKLTTLKTHLEKNQVNTGLVGGIAKRMRSRAAGQLMVYAMNNMAVMAAEAESAQRMQAENAGK